MFLQQAGQGSLCFNHLYYKQEPCLTAPQSGGPGKHFHQGAIVHQPIWIGLIPQQKFLGRRLYCYISSPSLLAFQLLPIIPAAYFRQQHQAHKINNHYENHPAVTPSSLSIMCIKVKTFACGAQTHSTLSPDDQKQCKCQKLVYYPSLSQNCDVCHKLNPSAGFRSFSAKARALGLSPNDSDSSDKDESNGKGEDDDQNNNLDPNSAQNPSTSTASTTQTVSSPSQLPLPASADHNRTAPSPATAAPTTPTPSNVYHHPLPPNPLSFANLNLNNRANPSDDPGRFSSPARLAAQGLRNEGFGIPRSPSLLRRGPNRGNGGLEELAGGTNSTGTTGKTDDTGVVSGTTAATEHSDSAWASVRSGGLRERGEKKDEKRFSTVLAIDVPMMGDI